MDNIIKNTFLFPMNILYKFKPELTLKILFRIKTGYALNLDDPITFNEKIQWMKLYYKNPLMPLCADKFEVRKYVEECQCGYLLNELLWHGYDAKEIPFDRLPKQFVIKTTHGSGFNIICHDKDKLDKELAIEKLSKWLKAKFIPCYGEWFYGKVKPRIIIEKYLCNEMNEVPVDYKVFCFDGDPKYIMVDTDRFKGHKRNVYDMDWRWMKGYKLGFPNDNPIKRPGCIEEIMKAARKLSKNFPHARVDFFIIREKVYFGEITFSNGAGFDKIQPYSFDVELGSYFNLPEKYKVCLD